MYFDKPGKENTQQALKWAAERGKELGIDEVVVASTTGLPPTRRLRFLKGPASRLSPTTADLKNPLRIKCLLRSKRTSIKKASLWWPPAMLFQGLSDPSPKNIPVRIRF